MAANPIVLSKSSQLYDGVNFDFLTWLSGSIVPGLVCALALPIIIRWSVGLSSDTKKRNDEEEGGDGSTGSGISNGTSKFPNDGIVKHAETELERMGIMSGKEWVIIKIVLKYITAASIPHCYFVH